uniref:Uncharacterized protein n=1 Tax=Cacopsylla melanoneura TaxID=428564 RepID=A0A8D9A9E9_9HEMI
MMMTNHRPTFSPFNKYTGSHPASVPLIQVPSPQPWYQMHTVKWTGVFKAPSTIPCGQTTTRRPFEICETSRIGRERRKMKRERRGEKRGTENPTRPSVAITMTVPRRTPSPRPRPPHPARPIGKQELL